MPKQPDRRRRTDAQKARTRRKRLERQATARRKSDWTAAAHIADRHGVRLNAMITLSLSLLADEYGAAPDFLALDPCEQDKRIWSALRRASRRMGFPFVAMRAPEHGGKRKRHVHIVFHAPDDRALLEAVSAIERITGTRAAWTDSRGKHLGNQHGVVALSGAGAWMVQRDVGDTPGNAGLISYVAKGQGKTHVDAQHRLSRDLIALTRAAG
jgi:hypothetical protein